MAVMTWTYALILLAGAVVLARLRSRAARGMALLALGLAFYTAAAGALVLPLVAAALLVHAVGRVLARDGRRVAPLVVTILALLLALVYFREARLVRGIAMTLGLPPRLAWSGPFFLGISYVAFQFIHYLVESRRRTLPAHGPLDVLAFTFFFPTVVSGPIKRFPRFVAELARPARAPWREVAVGGGRVLLGLFKKVVLADSLVWFVSALDTPATSPFLRLWIGAYAFTLKLYLDFSGYSDIAIGSARMMGIAVEENFDWPYLRANLSDFWKSWHMSLTGWLRDYVFIPLGGSRGGLARTTLNSFAVMVAIGLWHGLSANFLVWGIYHAAGLTLLRLYRRVRGTPVAPPAAPPAALGFARRAASTLLTFHFVLVGWVFFYCPLPDALVALSRMFLVAKWFGG
jgi:alginate O-acetyltransferase complex protein AlgI